MRAQAPDSVDFGERFVASSEVGVDQARIAGTETIGDTHRELRQRGLGVSSCDERANEQASRLIVTRLRGNQRLNVFDCFVVTPRLIEELNEVRVVQRRGRFEFTSAAHGIERI